MQTRECPVVSEITHAEACEVGGGLNPQPLPPGEDVAWWAVGTSSKFQEIMVQRLEVLGNPIAAMQGY